MTDNEKRAHDITIAVLPKALSEIDDSVYIFDASGIGQVNVSNICEAYNEIYLSVLKELS